jgi:hypothetical protein
MVLAGLGEGAVLIFLQATVLTSNNSGLSKRAWIRATMIGAGSAWVIGMAPSTLGKDLASVALRVLIPSAALLGVVLLLTIGVAQYVVLRHHAARAHTWIWANAVAWLAMALVMALVTGVSAERAMEQGAL